MNFERFSELWDKHVKNNPNMDYTPNPDMEPYVMNELTEKALIAYAEGDTSYFDDIEAKLKERKVEIKKITDKINKCFEPITAIDMFNTWSGSCPWSSVVKPRSFSELHSHEQAKWECLAENVNKRIENTKNAH